MRAAPPSTSELHAARDYLVGVFPLRFETPPAVVGAMRAHLMPDHPEPRLTRSVLGADGPAIGGATILHRAALLRPATGLDGADLSLDPG